MIDQISGLRENPNTFTWPAGYKELAEPFSQEFLNSQNIDRDNNGPEKSRILFRVNRTFAYKCDPRYANHPTCLWIDKPHSHWDTYYGVMGASIKEHLQADKTFRIEVVTNQFGQIIGLRHFINATHEDFDGELFGITKIDYEVSN